MEATLHLVPSPLTVVGLTVRPTFACCDRCGDNFQRWNKFLKICEACLANESAGDPPSCA